MSDPAKPHLIAADRLDGSIIVTFADGRCAVYSSKLLYDMLPQAEELHENREGTEDRAWLSTAKKLSRSAI